MNRLFRHAGDHLHSLLLFAILVALSATMWGWRPVRRPELPHGQRPQASQEVLLLVDRQGQRLQLFQGPRLLSSFDCRTDPEHHRRLPPGRYTIHHERDGEEGRIFVLAYPSVELAQLGLRHGWITRSEYDQIVEAHQYNLLPPQHTRLGSAPELIGGAGRNLLPGQIGVVDEDLERLAPFLEKGTSLVIR